MAKPCVISSCKNIGSHFFPFDTTSREKWVKAINTNLRPGITIKKSSRICLAHFKPSDYTISRSKIMPNCLPLRRRLKKTAVPSIFTADYVSLQPTHQASQTSQKIWYLKPQEPSEFKMEIEGTQHEACTKDSIALQKSIIAPNFEIEVEIESTPHENSTRDTVPLQKSEVDPISTRGRTSPNHISKSLDRTPSQEHLLKMQIDPKKLLRTYSRIPRVAFALVQPFFETQTNDIKEDPLKCGNEDNLYQAERHGPVKDVPKVVEIK